VSGSKKNIEIACYVCGDILPHDHIGIRCSQSHHMCEEHSREFVASVMSEPTMMLPAKCPICRVELSSEVFERFVPAEQQALCFRTMMSKPSASRLSADEVLVGCPFCDYAEIHPKDGVKKGMAFLFCGHPSCKKTSCIVCKSHVPTVKSDFPTQEEEETFLHHSRCQELAESKAILEAAIEGGMHGACPNCKLPGRKIDYQCTHMHCENCQSVWCYVCGMLEGKCNKANPRGNIYSHNRGWKRSCRRCPMYLHEIGTIDSTWPGGDDAASIEMFHRRKILQNLKKAFQKMGMALVRDVDEHFKIIESSGFTYDDIENVPDLLFERKK
jgi:hypothetical protein